MFDYQEELGGVFLNLVFQGGLELEGCSGVFSACGARSQLRFFFFSIHREMDRYVCGFCS